MKAERNAQIIEMYKSGMTLAAVGKSFGISRQRVQTILAKAGVERRSPSGAPARFDRDAVVREYGRLLSVYEVSKQVGCSEATVYGILAGAGIKTIRRSKLRELPMEAIKERYLSGEKLSDIAISFGIRSNYMNNLLRKYGVKARSSRGRKPRVAPGETAVDTAVIV